MNYFTKERLTSTLKGATDFLELNNSEKGSLVVSEYGGRPLGIFPKVGALNLLWVNPNLGRQIAQRSRDIGGDRYWLSPEQTFFYKSPESWEGWFCPDGLDPANYTFTEQSDKRCVLESQISVENQWTGELYRGEVVRKMKVIDEPIKTGVNYFGMEYTDECTLEHPDLNVNGWSLATVISGGVKNPGTVLIPTKQESTPISYFRSIPNERLHVDPDYVAYKIDVNEIYKLAIRPEDIAFTRKAKIGYVLRLPRSEEYGLLMKLSDDIPRSQDDCFDVARDHPDAEIGVVQSYNSESPNTQKLQFGEIELQLKRFISSNGKSRGISTHQLLGYIGTKEKILEVIEKYMGLENPKLY